MASEPNGQRVAETSKVTNVLVLQGGGALGAYQGGMYERLAQSEHLPRWISGISIGAVNGALIAGNAPADRVDRLRTFWHRVSSMPGFPGMAAPIEVSRRLAHEVGAATAVAFGQPGFFTPRIPPAPFNWPGTPESLSWYDTAPLRATLEELVDFDLINQGPIRLTVGAVDIRSGNVRHFDSARERIGPEHIMASAALPPAFPPVEIDGAFYWDGGIVANTPLQYVLEQAFDTDLLIFQVDLFSARGPLPRTLADVDERMKDIRYSSRTRHNTDVFRRQHQLRHAAALLLERLPAELRDDCELQRLVDASAMCALTIVHLIHRRKQADTQSKDYDFSRQTIDEHWRMGFDDLRHTFSSRAWRNRARPVDGVLVIDAGR